MVVVEPSPQRQMYVPSIVRVQVESAGHGLDRHGSRTERNGHKNITYICILQAITYAGPQMIVVHISLVLRNYNSDISLSLCKVQTNGSLCNGFSLV